MILEQLRLRNFCLYRGEQTLDLTPGRRNGKPLPIVLFGGINGGGKTTLLDAVQLVLYGVRARCSKRADKTYEEFLRDSIHHGADPDEGAELSLAFRYAEGGTQHLYEVTRSWYPVGNRIRETVDVTLDGKRDNWHSENWNQLVEEVIPLGIAQLCFFDAEKVRFLAEDETSTQALGAAIKALLGLDLAERLIADAAALETRVAKRAHKSDDLQQADELEAALQMKQAEVEALVQDLGALENPLLSAENRLKKAEDQFARIGGKHWEQRQETERTQAELEERSRHLEQQLVTLAATDLPLALVGDLLERVADQERRERMAAEASVVSDLLSERDQRLLEFIRESKASAKSQKLVKHFCEEDRQQRMAADTVEPRLQLSDGGRRLLDHLQRSGLKERIDTAESLLQELESTQRCLADAGRSLTAVPEEHTLQEVAGELKTASAEVTEFQQQANRLQKQLDSLRIERGELESRLSKLRRRVIDEELRVDEHARMAQLAVRTQETMREFLRRATARKIDRLSQLITESFRFLLRKQSLVEKVAIDPETFAITLYGSAGRAIEKQRLSEGEKQIFAVSVLWGLSRAAARPLPAIIDTPMARLDAEHRNQLVNRYFPHASHQVIVLSTDTEIDRRYFDELQPSIAHAYHLNYDEAEKVTVAEEGYFWESKSRQQREEVPA